MRVRVPPLQLTKIKKMKKYKLLQEDTIIYYGITLYRIEALIAFGNVEIGEKGGYIEKEDNLSQSGKACVSGEARVSFNCPTSHSFLTFGRHGASRRVITTNLNITVVNAGCFSGSFEEFKKAVVEDYGEDYGSYSTLIFILEKLKERSKTN